MKRVYLSTYLSTLLSVCYAAMIVQVPEVNSQTLRPQAQIEHSPGGDDDLHSFNKPTAATGAPGQRTIENNEHVQGLEFSV